MGDDGYSASQLRQRYGKGGSLQDSDLSAAQLRARHNVQGRDFKGGSGGGGSTALIVGGVVLCIVAGAAIFYLSQ